ncbi:hypothetical protein A3762_14320 [Oleiphilus sp. HI0125]|uniref:PhzF family phenazine biosynthesis protein n=1 Tax=Oleiphilus sp. HI0125 TaxID=1822266 RepID=UPI0007C25A11|nr:PhzF family phenazine biosynthesis isomerase [Oleiphilus sp. HI0125]KZZ61385.1 hypothetical protein A3762_14320 [Oleiphilus sp. HI0125]
MNIDIYQVDAFTDTIFKGNPAAVIPLDAPIDEVLMQSIAAENNLAETAFFYPIDGGYHLRWFTPTAEVPLCGHATLASAFVVFKFLKPERNSIRFNSASGWLVVNKRASDLELDFPLISYDSIDLPESVRRALGGNVIEAYRTEGDSNYLVVLESEAAVQSIDPDIRALKDAAEVGVIVTARSDISNVDFVSRYFAPAMGIDEDPVTGSIHCVLTPYWSERLNKKTLQAKQLSERQGELECELRESRVLIRGKTTLFMKGALHLDI